MKRLLGVLLLAGCAHQAPEPAPEVVCRPVVFREFDPQTGEQVRADTMLLCPLPGRVGKRANDR